MKARSLCAAVCLCAALSVHSLSAQIGGGSIVGIVSDPSGAPVPNAKVRAVNAGTNAVQETAANDAGYYEFPLLPAGSYRLEAEAQGFQRAVSGSIVLNSGTRPRIDLKLSLGQVTESVEVVASAPLVNATTTDLGRVIENRKIESLPLNGRNYLQLVGLQAGVVNNPSSSQGGRGGIEFHGSPASSNNLLLDGVDMSFGETNGPASDRSAGAGGDSSLIQTVSVEAIEEFKATGSAMSAEYGRAAGGVLNVTTKSGTNRFHGTLFEFFRNDVLDANSFFSNRSGLRKPPLRWNQFGGNAGGPIQKDKTFFFFNYEGAIVRRADQVVGNVPTPSLLAQVSPAIRQHLSGMPQDFTPTANPSIGLHRRNDVRKNDEHTTMSRVDRNFGKHRLAVRYNYNNQDISSAGLRRDNRSIYPTRFHNAAIQETVPLSPSAFNEFRLGFSRMDLHRSTTTMDREPGLVIVSQVGLTSDDQSRLHFTSNSYTVADNFTWIHGSHSAKMGFEIRNLRTARNQLNGVRHTYLTLNDLIADRSNTVQVAFGNPGRGLSTTNYGFFVQDDWRLTRRAQLNLGLRYDYSTPMKGAFNVLGSDPFGPMGTNAEGLYAPDRNNLAPRAGLVLDVLGSQKLVVRAGGGILVAPPAPLVFYGLNFIHPRVPFNALFNPADVPPDLSLAFPFPQAEFTNRITADLRLLPERFSLGRNVYDYNRRDEYSGQWNFSVQSALTAKLSVQASYVGSRALKLYSTRPVNQFRPQGGPRPRPEFGDVTYRESAANSTYHGLQLSANRKLSRGLAFDVYYTWSKNLSYYGLDGALPSDSTVQDPDDIRGSYGPKLGDVTHRFLAIPSYEIPLAGIAKGSRLAAMAFGGWTVQGILGRNSGTAMNVTAGVDLVGNQRVTGQRPDLVAGADPYRKDSNALTWLNPAAFDINTPRAARRFGNLGFNALREPAAFNFDAAVHKSFRIREGHRLAFRAEMFNAFNHVNFGTPNGNRSSPTFGQILSGSGGRNIQFALKYLF